MRRTLVPALAVVSAAALTTALGASSVAVAASPASTAVSAASAAQTSPAATLQANQAAARRDVAQHLQSLRLPGDVSSISAEPDFAKSFAFDGGPGTKYDAEDQATWSTAASPQTIIAYVKAHAPSGSSADLGTGSGSDSKTGVTSVDVQLSWPELSQRVFNRMLTVAVVTPRHGRSVVIAQTQSSWFVPRSSAEVVPRGVRAVLITLRLGPAVTGPVVKPGGHVQTSTYLVWRAARVRALVAEFNGLAIVQPGSEPTACPLMLTGSEASELTLAFKSARDGATLARTEVSVHRGQSWYDGAGACNPIDFWIGSRQQPSLMSTTFVKRVGKLIGTSIS